MLLREPINTKKEQVFLHTHCIHQKASVQQISHWTLGDKFVIEFTMERRQTFYVHWLFACRREDIYYTENWKWDCSNHRHTNCERSLCVQTTKMPQIEIWYQRKQFNNKKKCQAQQQNMPPKFLGLRSDLAPQNNL